MADKGGRASSPTLTSSGWSCPCPLTRVSSIVLPRRGAGPSFHSAAPGDGQGQFSLVLQPVGLGQFCVALFSRPAVVTGAMDVNTDCDCRRTTNPGKGLSSSPGLGITNALDGASKPPTLARSSLPSPLQICLCPQDMNHSVSFSLPYPAKYLLTIIVPALDRHVGLLLSCHG